MLRQRSDIALEITDELGEDPDALVVLRPPLRPRPWMERRVVVGLVAAGLAGTFGLAIARVHVEPGPQLGARGGQAAAFPAPRVLAARKPPDPERDKSRSESRRRPVHRHHERRHPDRAGHVDGRSPTVPSRGSSSSAAATAATPPPVQPPAPTPAPATKPAAPNPSPAEPTPAPVPASSPGEFF